MSTSRAWVRLLVLGCVVAVIACGRDPTQATPCPDVNHPITVIAVTTGDDTLTAVGDSTAFLAQAKDARETVCQGVAFTWASADTAIATVSASGMVRAVANGSTVIRATAAGVTDSAAVTVAQRVASVLVAPGTATVAAGDSQQFSAAARDANAHPVAGVSFVWASSNQGVATVTQSGTAAGVAAGTATISATVAGAPAGTATLTVTNPPTQVAFIAPPATTRGNLLSSAIEVELRDVSGARVATATNAVTLAMGTNPASGTLSGTTTVNAVNGVARFSDLAVDKAGAGYTLVATAAGLTGATSAPFDVLGYRLVVTTPPPALIEGNDPFGFTVQVTDAAGGVVPTAADTVTLTLVPPPLATDATVMGTVGSVAVNGVATFSGLRVDLPGTGYALEARARGIGPVATTAFRVKLTFQQISVGRHMCGVTTNHSVYCWGNNPAAQSDNGPAVFDSIPHLVPGGLPFRQVAGGEFHSCGLTLADELYCWGNNGAGQLGIGSPSTGWFPTPQRVPTPFDRRFTQVAAGSEHTCATTVEAGTGAPAGLYCWGSDLAGQLGDDSAFASQRAPALVAGGFAWKRVDGGSLHTCAIRANDVAYCWGMSAFGQLGVPSASGDVPTPLAVSTTLYADAVGGLIHSCFRRLAAPRDILCSGNNDQGQLGDGSTTSRYDEVPLANQLAWTTVTAGQLHTCMLDDTGTAYCVGRNAEGQLGNGTNTGATVRVPVSGSHVSTDIGAGDATCGLKANGEVWCWGTGLEGQLGNGARASSNVPVQVVQ